jgi:deoxyribose-phosphate aldolase
MNVKEIASLIDHTLLKSEATCSDVERICEEAAKYNFGCVFVNSQFLPLANKILRGSSVRLGSVAGFPLGASHTLAKVREAEIALENGALEVDMVVQVGLLKSRALDLFVKDIKEVVDLVHQAKEAHVKAILEVGLLSEEELKLACELAGEAGVDYVKSCTGFGPRGVTVNDIEKMRKYAPSHVKVKASGGIRHYEEVISLLEAGADRIGTSASVSIMEEARGKIASG